MEISDTDVIDFNMLQKHHYAAQIGPGPGHGLMDTHT